MIQQSLPLKINTHFSFADYYPGPNRLIINTLQHLSPGDSVYLWGKPGVGCSHLLQASCQHQPIGESMYIDLGFGADPSLLENLDNIKLIAIDHLENIIGQTQWEEALFHLYNRLLQQQGILLIAAGQSPDHLTCQLADLKSRLNAMLVLNVKSLTDDDKCQALQLQAKQRGFELPEEVARYLLLHMSRDWTYLLQQLTVLDQAALQAKRRLTIPFVRECVNKNILVYRPGEE